MKKKIALLLAMVMIVSLMPMTVFGFSVADGEDRTLTAELAASLAFEDEYANGFRVFKSDGSLIPGWEWNALGPITYALQNNVSSDGFIGLELTHAVWTLPDSGTMGSIGDLGVGAASARRDYRIDGNMMIGEAAATNGGTTLLYALERVSSTYARVTFYNYNFGGAAEDNSANGTNALPADRLPDASALRYAGNNNLWRVAAGVGAIFNLPIELNLSSTANLNESWNRPQLRSTISSGAGTITSTSTEIFQANPDVVLRHTNPSALYDGIQVFYFGNNVTNPSGDIVLGRISVQEHGTAINRFNINIDAPFMASQQGNTNLVRRYVTLTAPEGYDWEYNTQLYNTISNGSYNLIYNPTGVFADPTQPSRLIVDQYRNKNNTDNELILDLDFPSVPRYLTGAFDAEGRAISAVLDDARNSSFEIAPGLLRLVPVENAILGNTVPVKLTITNYNGDHIITRSIDVAQYAAGTSITLTASSASASVVGGAFAFSNVNTTPEPGTAVGPVVYREGSANQAGNIETLRFTVAGATLIGARVSYVNNSDAAVNFGSDSRTYIPVGRTAYRLNPSGGAYTTNDNVTVVVNDNNTIDVRNLAGAVDGTLAITITPYVVASVDTAVQDITVTSTNTNNPSAWETTTVKVGATVVPVTAVVESQAKGSLGKDIKGGTIVITETQAGVINGSDHEPTTITPVMTSRSINPKELTVSLQNDVFGTVRFMEKADVLSCVTAEGLTVTSAKVDANGILRIVFAGKSTSPATITIKDVPFAANRLTYNGSYEAYIGGSALAANYNDGVITHNDRAIKATITVPSFVSISDSNIGTGSLDTVDGKTLIAQITVDRDGGETTGSVIDVASGIETVLDPSPIITNGRTYMPLVSVSALLGIAEEGVTWDSATNTAMVEDGDRAVYFTKNSTSFTVYNAGVVTTMEMDGAAFNKDGRMYIPVRYLVNGLFDGTAQEDASSLPNNRIINVYDGR